MALEIENNRHHGYQIFALVARWLKPEFFDYLQEITIVSRAIATDHSFVKHLSAASNEDTYLNHNLAFLF